MRTLAMLLVATCSVSVASVTSAQTPSTGSLDRIVRVTQRWGASSPLGALPTRSMGADDVELRVWGGYGVGGSWGFILRRTAGRWQVWRARVVTCVITLPLGTDFSPPDSLVAVEARRNCVRFPENYSSFQTADTLALEPADARNAGAIWERAVSGGVLDLPPRVVRTWMAVHDCTIVIETRRGDVYRASRFETIKPAEVDADRVARRVYEEVMREYGAALRTRGA